MENYYYPALIFVALVIFLGGTAWAERWLSKR